MPRGDKTGPMGQGPRTGRGLGYCSGYSYPGYMNPYGFGRGRGWRWPGGFAYPYGLPHPYSPEPLTSKEEKEMLNEDLRALRGEMKAIEERLKELENKKTKK